MKAKLSRRESGIDVFKPKFGVRVLMTSVVTPLELVKRLTSSSTSMEERKREVRGLFSNSLLEILKARAMDRIYKKDSSVKPVNTPIYFPTVYWKV